MDASFLGEFEKRLKELRESQGLTLQNLADKTGINRVTLTNYENGTRHPDERTMTMIARYFDVSLDYLVGISDIKSYDTSIKSICEKTGLSETTVGKLQKHHEIINLLFDDQEFLSCIEDYIGVAFYDDDAPSFEINTIEKDVGVNSTIAKTVWVRDGTNIREVFDNPDVSGFDKEEASGHLRPIVNITESLLKQALINRITNRLSHIREEYQKSVKIKERIHDFFDQSE